MLANMKLSDKIKCWRDRMKLEIPIAGGNVKLRLLFGKKLGTI